MNSIAIYPGTFDPITKGHIDVIKRSAALYSELKVAVLNNPQKKSLLTLEQRLALTKEVLSDIKNVSIESFDGLLIDYAINKKANVIVRSFRNGSDIDYELPQAMMNRKMKDIETVFLTPSPELSYISSSLVREVITLGGDVSPFVTAHVKKFLEKLNTLDE